MASVGTLQQQLSIARNELKNIRQEISKLKKVYAKDVDAIKSALSSNFESSLNDKKPRKFLSSYTQHDVSSENILNMKPIGYITSCFKSKNGTPRQASLCPGSKAFLSLNKDIFSKPHLALDGLNDFSHIWILFIFHDNSSNTIPKAKIHPPKLNGSSIGVFASRSPHRPNPIGLSLVQLIKIEDSTLTLSGIDLIDGTPVLDIKPYIPAYDSPFQIKVDYSRENVTKLSDFKVKSDNSLKTGIASKSNPPHNYFKLEDRFSPDEINVNEKNSQTPQQHSNLCKIPLVKTATWVTEQQNSLLEVSFSSRAEKELAKFHCKSKHDGKCEFCLSFITGSENVKMSIINILKNDPRSVYRRTKCKDKLYYFTIDSIHITCWFDDCLPLVEVLRVQPLTKAIFMNKLSQENDDM